MLKMGEYYTCQKGHKEVADCCYSAFVTGNCTVTGIVGDESCLHRSKCD